MPQLTDEQSLCRHHLASSFPVRASPGPRCEGEVSYLILLSSQALLCPSCTLLCPQTWAPGLPCGPLGIPTAPTRLNGHIFTACPLGAKSLQCV